MAQLPLTMLVDVSVSGGAVTNLSSGAISLVSGTVYSFEIGTINNTASSIRIWINSDTTDGNYRRTSVRSSNTLSTSSNTCYLWADTTGQENSVFGTLGIENSTPYIFTCEQNERATIGTNYGAFTGFYNISETTFVELTISGAAASSLQNGTYLRIWEAIQS